MPCQSTRYEFAKNLLRAATVAIATLTISGVASALTVNLSAVRATTTLPDGNTVRMWAFSNCQPSASGVTPAVSCPTDGSATWTPGPTIVVPTDSTGYGSLTINLTNNLPTPTSIVILGQLNSNQGSSISRLESPAHSGQPAVTWPAADSSVAFTPPAQAARAVSFGAEAGANAGVQTYTWAKLRPGTYLYETGSVPSLQAPMGLYGVLIVTQAPVAGTGGTAGLAYPNAVANKKTPYDADVALLFSEIDPRQNAAVDAAAIAGASVLKLFSDPTCATSACYPPAVNYAPTYFLINGHAFDPTQPNTSGVAVSDNQVLSGGGQVLVRLLNAGLRTHVPSIVGLPTPPQIVAEDGFVAPGNPKSQTHMLMPAGKTLDLVISPSKSATAYANASFPIFDRALSLSSSNLDTKSAVVNSGMIGFIALQPAGTSVGAAGGATVPKALNAVANADTFATPVGTSFNGNVLSNDVNVVTAAVAATTTHGVLIFNADGSFAYTPTANYVGSDTFTYTGNNNAAIHATVTITVGTTAAPIANADTFGSKVASVYKSSAPGVLANDTDAAGTKVALTALIDAVGSGCASVNLLADGSFTAVPNANSTSCTFSYHAQNSLGANSAVVSATVTFATGSGLLLTVKDTQDKASVDDYSWVIEEDTTFFHDPKKPAATNTLATNFHKSYMPVIASGCTGPSSCGDANSVGGTTTTPRPRSFPKDVVLDPNKRYYVSVLPGDADQGDASFNADGSVSVNAYGHAMGGVSIAAGQTAATVLVPRNPLPPSQLSVIVFEDSNPTNGGVDDGEQGLGGFTINLYDTRGSSGDPAGLMTYDLSAMPFTNSLANQKDSATGENLCPMNTPSGTIITCPELTDRRNASPLAGMALIKNINPGRYDVWATPGADRAIKGEKWIQVSTLEGTHANDTFVKPGEPAYWQEFGPPGFHSFIGFINPAHIAAVTQSQKGKTTVTGRVPSLHMDRPRPTMANLNNSCATGTNPDGTPINAADPTCRATLSATICYVAVNSNSGAGGNPTVAMASCDENGNFSIKNVPAGQHELVIWDQWLDQIISYKALTVPTPPATGTPPAINMGDIPVFTWFTRIEQSAYQDQNGNGIRDSGEPGVSQIPMNIRFRDGSISNFLATDSTGSGGTNELFPLFNWYVLESDTTRYTGTGVFTAYDAGGKPDTTSVMATDLNGNSVKRDFSGVLRSAELYPLDPADQIPSSTYTPNSTMRIDAGTTLTEGTQGYINQTTHVEWGKRPYVPGENGGITGMVYYASTRGFDDPSLEVQFSWEPGIAGVPVNLYQEVKNADGSVTKILVDHTTTSSWDDSSAGLKCPGSPKTGDPFVDVTLGGNNTKCYDGQHSFNQVQPAAYDGRYKFPTANCTICLPNPANSLPASKKPASVVYPPVLPTGTYVVQLVLPPGYELVKEEDKNILIGDSWIAPAAATQFLGVGNVFILPDQATLNDANIIGSNLASAFPPCVGTPHLVPDYLTFFPGNQQNAPYAGQLRPLCDQKEVGVGDQGQGGADFQLFTQTPIAGHISGIMLNDAAAEFDPYNPAFLEKASLPNAPISVRDYNGVEIQRIYNDRYGTFNNLVPSTWEANVPNPSGYAPNMLTYCMNDPGPIPDPSGATDPKTGKLRMIVDPMYNPMFSNFCYNWPSMPGITTYLDTPVLPVSAFASASSYEPVDCAYPASTPAIYRVDGSNAIGGGNVGPVIDLGKGRSLTITALGDVQVPNPAYEGPNAVAINGATNQPNQPKITRHYGFGNTAGTVKVGNTTLNITSWTDTSITATVPGTSTAAFSGELLVTNAAGVKSVDTVTVTVGTGNAVKATYVAAPDTTTSGANTLPHPIQDAIDAANPGDLIIVDAGNYSELVVMDRPVRLQGVGAAATVINATKYPNQKVDQWRTRINNLFGLDNQGNTLPGNPAVDPLPGQEITGGIVQLEPSVLATEEGAGITVLAKGYRADATTLLSNCSGQNKVRGNFRCASARIDGLSVTGGDAGGGIYINGWAHGLEVSNNRVFGNAGPFSGGIRIGQPYLEGQAIDRNFSGLGYDENILVHNNAITNNGTVEGNAAAGALAAAAGGAGGGLSICAGSDGYKVTGNWICGNYSSSDGGGIGHIGLSNKGLIQDNKIIFNESYNQSGAQFGGGLVIEGEGAAGGALTLGTGNVTVDRNLIQGNFARAGSGGGIRLQSVNGGEIGVSGVTPWSITITNNMIVNNVAAWAGAGISVADTLFSNIVGNTIASNDSTGIAGNLFNTQIGTGNTGPTTAIPNPAGISSELTSAPLLAVLSSAQANANRISDPHLVNNIVWHNRSFFFNMDGGKPQLSPSNTWSDALLGTKPVLGTPGSDGCTSADKYWDLGVVGDTSAVQLIVGPTTRNVQTASQSGTGGNRLVTVTTTAALGMSVGTQFNVTIAGITGGGTGGTGTTNRARYNVSNATATVTGASAFTYQPTNGGVNGTTFATLNFSAATATFTPPSNPVIAAGNTLLSAGNPNLLKPYCNASRALPGLQFEPGTPFQPAFNISVSATLDESGNFVDLHFGPLSLQDQATGTTFNGDYHLAGASGDAYNTGGTTAPANVTTFGQHDFDNDARPQQGAYDKGADELVVPVPQAGLAPTSLAFGNVAVNTTKVMSVTLSNTGTAPLVISGITVSGTALSLAPASTCGTSLPAGANCTISVTFAPTALGAVASGSVTVTDNDPTTPTANIPVTGTGVAAFTLSPAPLSFGNITRGSNSTQNVTLTNNTGAALTNLAAALTTPGSSTDFSIRTTGSCGTSLAAGNSCTFAIRFAPLSTDTRGSTQSRTLTVNGRQNNVAITALTVSISGVAN